MWIDTILRDALQLREKRRRRRRSQRAVIHLDERSGPRWGWDWSKSMIRANMPTQFLIELDAFVSRGQSEKTFDSAPPIDT